MRGAPRRIPLDQRNTRVRAVCSRLVCLGAVLVLIPTTGLRAIQESKLISVDDPRPLNAAVKLIEQRCHCSVTYEDPKWGSEDVVDISGSVWHRPDIQPRIPNGGRFTFSIPPNLSGLTAEQMRVPMEQVLAAFDRARSFPGAFRVTTDNTGLHVIPQSGSVLDEQVAVAPVPQRIIDIVTAIVDQVAQVTGHKIGIATYPTNLLKRSVKLEAHQGTAQAVLGHALQASGRALSWRLFYDVGMGQYYLGIHFVP